MQTVDEHDEETVGSRQLRSDDAEQVSGTLLCTGSVPVPETNGFTAIEPQNPYGIGKVRRCGGSIEYCRVERFDS